MILGASYLFPDIEKNIENYVACSFGLKLDPEPLDVSYNKWNDTFEIHTRATGRRTFNDLGFIKFLDKTTESNVCDKTGFQYQA